VFLQMQSCHWIEFVHQWPRATFRNDNMQGVGGLQCALQKPGQSLLT